MVTTHCHMMPISNNGLLPSLATPLRCYFSNAIFVDCFSNTVWLPRLMNRVVATSTNAVFGCPFLMLTVSLPIFAVSFLRDMGRRRGGCLWLAAAKKVSGYCTPLALEPLAIDHRPRRCNPGTSLFGANRKFASAKRKGP